MILPVDRDGAWLKGLDPPRIKGAFSIRDDMISPVQNLLPKFGGPPATIKPAGPRLFSDEFFTFRDGFLEPLGESFVEGTAQRQQGVSAGKMNPVFGTALHDLIRTGTVHFSDLLLAGVDADVAVYHDDFGRHMRRPI